MKRFFAKVGRFFWSWGFLKLVLAIIALIILLYIEEDWRGAHAWAATKAKWEAKGESFDRAKFIPPPIPDDQNLAAIPLFDLKEEQSQFGPNLRLLNLEKALRQEPGEYPDIPLLGNWMNGYAPDSSKISKTIADDCGLIFKGQNPPTDTLAQFDALFPFTGELRRAAATRSILRWNMNYRNSPPGLRPLGPVVKMIALTQVMTLHSVLALDHKQQDLALADIKINYDLLLGSQRDPSLVGGLVAIGIAAISNAALYDGLEQHVWSDVQLAELEHTLGSVDFLTGFLFTVRAQVANTVGDETFFKSTRPSSIPPMFFEATYAEARLFHWPGGWWDNNVRQIIDFHFEQAETIDPEKQLVFPNLVDAMTKRVEQKSHEWDAYFPWNVWFTEAAPNETGVTLKFAQAQVWIDEARIACALERYHLAKGIYPDALAALAPTYIDELPHDIMNGQPYHYSLRQDGTFLLYSAGWNQIDDGGKIAYEKDNPKAIDYTEGDWVWPTPQNK